MPNYVQMGLEVFESDSMWTKVLPSRTCPKIPLPPGLNSLWAYGLVVAHHPADRVEIYTNLAD